MRYFFQHVCDGSIFDDPEGSNCAGDAEAIGLAIASAREIMSERLRHGLPLGDDVFHIVDADDRLVANVDFAEAIPSNRKLVGHMQSLPSKSETDRMPEQENASAASDVRFQNAILSALPTDQQDAFAQLVEPVSIERGMVLQKPGETPEFAYFLEGGIVSFTVPMPTGDQAEFGIVGKEGIAGFSGFFEGQPSPVEAVVQVGGATAYRMAVGDLRQAVDSSTDVQRLFFRYLYEFMGQMAYTAISNARHTLPQRLARWLLLCNDRLDGDEIPLTHSFMSMMLGSQRTSVTSTLHILEGEGAIYSRRGVVVMRDRVRLEACAGEAYRGSPFHKQSIGT